MVTQSTGGCGPQPLVDADGNAVSIYVGDNGAEVTFKFEDANGNPVDLTGFALRARAKLSIDCPNTIFDVALAVLDPLTGEAVLTFTSALTGIAYEDMIIEIYDSAVGQEKTYVQATLTINKSNKG